MKDIFPVRKEYKKGSLSENDLPEDPLDLFFLWFSEAIDLQLPEVNAAALATANKDGCPSLRTVLIKEIDSRGFVFYTNYQSRKGRDLEENPRASLMIYRSETERQITVEGRVEKISEKESEKYFAGRPRESRLAAICSPQGQEIPSGEFLRQRYLDAEEEFHGKDIPKPSFWGGFRLIPERYTFWQGREYRLHDRFLYRKIAGNEWKISRLAP